jgi:hypothetical protein
MSTVERYVDSGEVEQVYDRRLAALTIVASSCAARKTRKLHGGVRVAANIPIIVRLSPCGGNGDILDRPCSTQECQQRRPAYATHILAGPLAGSKHTQAGGLGAYRTNPEVTKENGTRV